MPGGRLQRILAELSAGGQGWSSARLCGVCPGITGVTGAGVMLMSGEIPRGSLCTSDGVSQVIEAALQNIMSNLRPGAWVAAGGGKWAPWAMMALNLQVRTLHAPYVRSFTGFGRPWNHLEELIEDIHVREVALGSGYILTGHAPRPRRRRPSRKLGDNGTDVPPRPVSGRCITVSGSHPGR
jgi:hypothetical protein